MNRSLAPLRHRMFAILWTGAFVSNIGTWMEAVGVGILVTEATNESIWTALVAAAGFAPLAVLGPVGGALADRLPRKRLLLITTTIQTALATTLTVLVATGSPGPGIVTLIVFASGCAQSIGFPAFQAVLPDLVPQEDLVGAVALSSAQWNLGRVIGPALAGVLIAVGGYAAAFAFNAASFLAVIFAVTQLRLPPPIARLRQSIRSEIREGLAYVRRDPGLRVVVAYMCVNTLLAAPFIALVPAMSKKVFDAGASGTALLVTAQGLGAVTMALSLAALAARFGNRRVMLMVLWGVPPALVAYALMPLIALSAVTIFFVGLLYLGALSSFTSIAQLRAPAAVRGRVLSVLLVLLGSLYPIGAVVQGAIADEIGLRATTAGAGALMLGILLLARLVRPGFALALEAPAAPLEGFASGSIEAP
ncbi:MAG: MFS transporter [Acidimicrobiia bacterium]